MKRMDFMLEKEIYEFLRGEAFRNRKSIGAVIRERLRDRSAREPGKETNSREERLENS